MLRIACPNCGVRDHEEFGYFGDASKVYPPLGEQHREAWFEAVFMRDNRRGQHREFWQHVGGCRRWLVVERDTVTHDIAAVHVARERPL
jgi:heterotetrameric sarcosine oxidase delta subunit